MLGSAVDIDLFQPVAGIESEIIADRYTERDIESEAVLAVVGVVFVVVVVVVQIAVEERNVERDIAVDEVRLVETQADLTLDFAYLAGKADILAVTQEVVLVDLSVEDKTLERRETGADVEGAALSLDDSDIDSR